MAPGRYELNEAQWQRIKDTLPGRLEHVGRTAVDNRLFVNAVLWVLRSGARWHDLPERYGKYKSVPTRFMRWARAGVWEGIFADPDGRQEESVSDDRLDHRAGHQHSAGARKKTAATSRPGAVEGD